MLRSTTPVDAAVDGDIVRAMPGVYLECLDFRGKAIAVEGSGPEVTALDGLGRDAPVVTFRSGEARASVLTGFTVRGGMGLPSGGTRRGGGIAVSGSAAPEIRNNVIARNEAEDGGGLWFSGAAVEPRIHGNRIEANLATRAGGGIHGELAAGGTEIVRNVLTGNIARGAQAPVGAAMLLTGVTARVCENTVVRNRAGGGSPNGGASLALVACEGTLVERNILAYAVAGSALRCTGGSPVIRNNLLWQNAVAEDGGDCAAWWETDGNVIEDPELCGADEGDYRPSNSSPVLLNPAGPIGAFSDPGCGAVPIRPATWGSLKTRY